MKTLIRSIQTHLKLIVITLGLILAYGITRFVNPTLLPMFTDEAIYIRWAQVALHDASFRFISLTDGKQPSFIWIIMILLRYINDPLLAGRLASMIAGLFGMIGMFLLAYVFLKDKKIGFMSSVFYIISPFFLVYDRLALYDSLTAVFTIWSLLLTVLVVQTKRLDYTLILGMVLGGGVLTKSSAFFNLVASFIAIVFLYNWKQFSWKEFIKTVGLIILSSLIAIIMYNALRLSPWFYIIGRKNEEFVYSIPDWLSHPVQYFLPNMEGLTKWLFSYLTIPVVILVFVGLFMKRVSWNKKLFLLTVFFAPYLYLALFGKVLFPRFILFMTVPLYILAAGGFVKILSIFRKFFRPFGQIILQLSTYGLMFIFFGYSIYVDYTIIARPIDAPLPHVERFQYIDNWPSGYGLPEVVAYLRKESVNHNIFVATEGTFGLFPASLDIYFYGNNRIKTKGYWPMTEDIIRKELVLKAKEKPTYLIFKESQDIPDRWPLLLIKEIRRGKGDTFLRLYQVLPENPKKNYQS